MDHKFSQSSHKANPMFTPLHSSKHLHNKSYRWEEIKVRESNNPRENHLSPMLRSWISEKRSDNKTHKYLHINFASNQLSNKIMGKHY